MLTRGKIYMIPVPIDIRAPESIPLETLSALHSLKYFIAERAKTCRQYLKLLSHPMELSGIEVAEIDKHGATNFNEILQPVFNGESIGVMSESGCPGIADPGSKIVAFAHQNQIEVVPLTGPSSLLLSLMASGFSGQSFAFNGYLPNKKDQLRKKIKQLELLVNRTGQTQIFIETPYRNTGLIEELCSVLEPSTLLSVQSGLTGPDKYSMTKTIKMWQSEKPSAQALTQPTVFLIGIF